MGRRYSASRFARLVLPAIFATLLSFATAVSQGNQGTAFDLAERPADPFKLSAKKVVVLIFVRTDCPVSNRYAPTIQRLNALYEGKAAFWLVYPSRSESAETIRKYENEYGYKIPALRDPQHVLVKESRVQITPEVAVFNASHRLIYHGRIDDLYVDIGRTRSAPTTHELDDAIQSAASGNNLTRETKPAVGCYISDLE